MEKPPILETLEWNNKVLNLINKCLHKLSDSVQVECAYYVKSSNPLSQMVENGQCKNKKQVLAVKFTLVSKVLKIVIMKNGFVW